MRTITVSAILFRGCQMFIRKPICHVHGVNFLYDLGFLGPRTYGYMQLNSGRLEDLNGQYCHNNSCMKGKSTRFTDLKQVSRL